MMLCAWGAVRTFHSKHFLPRLCQREPAPLRVEARHARLLRRAGKPAALPHLAIAEHWQRLVHHGVAVAEARGGAFGVHLEGAAVIKLAIGGASRFCFHRGDVAAEDVLLVVVEILAGDVLGWGLEADGTGLSHRGIGGEQQHECTNGSERNFRHVSSTVVNGTQDT